MKCDNDFYYNIRNNSNHGNWAWLYANAVGFFGSLSYEGPRHFWDPVGPYGTLFTTTAEELINIGKYLIGFSSSIIDSLMNGLKRFKVTPDDLKRLEIHFNATIEKPQNNKNGNRNSSTYCKNGKCYGWNPL